MPFCINCGQEVDENCRFCPNCGTPIYSVADEKQEKRKTVYEGEVHKCPNCGEVLNSFAVTCPSCGYEIRGNKSSDTVQEFAMRLSQLSDEGQKIMLIRSFPIPNTKEDIVEFIILASTNIQSKVDNELSDAWQVKFEQAYQKACMLFKGEEEFQKVQEIHLSTSKKLTKLKQVRKIKNAGIIVSELTPVLSNLVVIAVWLISIFIVIPICKIGLDETGFSTYSVILWSLFVGGIFLIPPFTQGESSLPRLVTVLGLVLSILVLLVLSGKGPTGDDYNTYQLLLAHAIICGVITLIKMAKNKSGTAIKPDRVSFVVALIMLGLFFVTYLASSLIVSLGNHTDLSNANANTDGVLEWPKSELATQIPELMGVKGEITFNDDEKLWIEVKRYPESEYETYIEECKSKGFTIEGNKSGIGYEAYNKDGYHLKLSYMDSRNELNVRVEAPRAVEELEWPTIGLALLIPIPDAKHGDMEVDAHDRLSVYVGDTSKEEYKDYVNSCIKKGFDIDYSKNETEYKAKDQEGNSLSVTYEGGNVIHISVESPDD